jgi:hypothetical protein
MDAFARRPTLQQSIETVLARAPEMPAATAGLRPGMVAPMALADDLDRLASWLDVQAIAAEDMDARTRAAYMIGGISWSVACWVAAFTLLDLPLPGGLAVSQERYWWGEGADAHEYVRYPVGLIDGKAPTDARALFETMFAPLIAATMVTAGLSPGAQWRLVADSVAQGFLHVGKGLDAVPRAMALADAILAEGRLNNGKTAFAPIELPARREWFVSRGGCCRYYTTRGGEYCSSCVLRKREDQEARYRAYFLSVAAE